MQTTMVRLIVVAASSGNEDGLDLGCCVSSMEEGWLFYPVIFRKSTARRKCRKTVVTIIAAKCRAGEPSNLTSTDDVPMSK